MVCGIGACFLSLSIIFSMILHAVASLFIVFIWFFLFGIVYLLFVYCLFRAAPVACGVSQVRSQIRAEAAGLHHSHSNLRAEPRLPRPPQLTTTPDPKPTEQGWGSNPHPQRYESDSFPLSHNGNSSLPFYDRIILHVWLYHISFWVVSTSGLVWIILL